METYKFEFSRSQTYDLLLGGDILPSVVARLSRMGFHRRCAILTNETVSKWYLEPLRSELKRRNFEIEAIILPDGEETKSLATIASLYSKLLEFGLDRKCPLITLGGGVIGDLGGFAASTFLRGIPHISIPTTLLAMVDASIGGKAAVNLPEGKNLVGSFYQPVLVGVDIFTLKTLPLTQISYGLVECVKHGIIADPAYYKFILKNREAIKEKNLALLQRLVRRSLNIKKAFVEEDELDLNRRALLNFGHSFGHALEAMGEYRRFHHGEAIGIGMLMAVEAARELTILKEDFFSSLEGFLHDFNLPTRIPREFECDRFLKAMLRDKKRGANKFNLILPAGLGKVDIHPLPEQELSDLIKSVVSSLYA